MSVGGRQKLTLKPHAVLEGNPDTQANLTQQLLTLLHDGSLEPRLAKNHEAGKSAEIRTSLPVL